MRHEPVRVWYAPWRKRCSCGCEWYPCPDAATIPPPSVTRSLHLTEDDDPEHTWERPSWECRSCGSAWPCEPARAILAAEADRVSLALYMSGHLEQAVVDLPRRPPHEMFDRFLRWTHVRPAHRERPHELAGLAA
ncbi:hypothetical protein BJY16_009073 [Actinoplanes octamycinicus]|uniref:Uncharacterized protein n=1 Tax=Actinoplanes octamycinicus TaxID=135948 RepID=A0A7W7H7Z5_9ACTN|nr:hypothetical protein [Actinoplanes octamycinicus]MBB4745614.1 hypothetical protein [Actinoplanes octamycinicus]